ncbi:MAG: sigma-70 family RNA polymerase sigma factor [Vicinamibacteria bacterium]
MSGPGELTELLRAYAGGDAGAFDRLVPLVYDDLRRVARQQLRRGTRGVVLDTTALVHEVWFKLSDGGAVPWQDRGHFLAVSARAMRQVIVDEARRRNAGKRGGGQADAVLDEGRVAAAGDAFQVLAIDQALDRLAARSPRLARVVECRFFAGLGEEETAEALGVSLRTVQREWTRARAWLREDLSGPPAAPA